MKALAKIAKSRARSRKKKKKYSKKRPKVDEKRIQSCTLSAKENYSAHQSAKENYPAQPQTIDAPVYREFKDGYIDRLLNQNPTTEKPSDKPSNLAGSIEHCFVDTSEQSGLWLVLSCRRCW